ncbi:hypothetical protein [Winogradskyella immobilis]|uniref:Uncharacterized protein n=1 Tax=Winogradskyella immobilis TaxID=2816852 RepID=A0ABS8EQ33_9FLAO|nr:hypothetical protein [Winogradskyella immobilis]MCC1484422.1 hypothetical protein [Winogradskyella immobilis]MCG0016514.1 hypothetical protein [Winogradskyella immobilis]
MKKVFLCLIFLLSLSLMSFTSIDKIEGANYFEECNIKIKGTFNGKPIDVVVTVEADDCAVAAGKVLKAQTE